MTEQQRKGRGAVEMGPTSTAVAANVRRLRERRGLSTYQLSGQLGRAGRPISPSAISKLERGERQVTVDDLTALAAVLNVSPAALLLPLDDSAESTIDVTGAGAVPADVAWSWVLDERPLRLPEGDARTAMLEHQLYSLPPGRRHTGGVYVRGERTPEQLRAKREHFERLASWGAVDLEAERRRDPEPWEGSDG